MEKMQNYLLEALQRLEKLQKEKEAARSLSKIEQQSVEFLKELIQEQVKNENNRSSAGSIR